jgi:thioredoxin reductase (NADPH)
VLKKIEGASRVTAVEVENFATGEVNKVRAEIVLVRIGVEPNSELFRDSLDLDDRGYIKVDASCRTSLEGIYAAGDVANPVSPTLITAAGMGSTAAKAAYLFIKTQQSEV